MYTPGLFSFDLLVIVQIIGLKLSLDRVARPVSARVNLLDAMLELPEVNCAVFVGVTEIEATVVVLFPVVTELGHVMNRRRREASN